MVSDLTSNADGFSSCVCLASKVAVKHGLIQNVVLPLWSSIVTGNPWVLLSHQVLARNHC